MTQKKSTILVIEDELAMRRVLGFTLEDAGYKMVESDNGREGERLAASVRPDLIILDLQLPDMDGRDIIVRVREWSQIPIIVCSACIGDDAVVHALNIGADDYIIKPFNPAVMLARIHANLRKAVAVEAGEPELVNGSIRMDLVRHEVFLNGKKATFSPKEYELLRYFLIHRGKMLTHRDILKSVWGNAHTEDLQYLRVYVRQLREKLEANLLEPRYIVTESGIGYRMESIAETVRVPEKAMASATA